MRVIVMFDFPSDTNEDKRIYRWFRKGLLKEGFIMIQYSVYSRFCRNDSEYAKYVNRVKRFAPKQHGEVRIVGITEKQYERMYVISAERKSDEQLLSICPLVEL